MEKCDCPDIERERSCDKYVPMTQGDKIRSMTDEELEELIYKTHGCPVDDKVCYLGKGCNICILEWLKSEVGCEYMLHARLSKEDPVYYKCVLQGLIEEAKENGLEVTIGENYKKEVRVYFTSDNGECAGARII